MKTSVLPRADWIRACWVWEPGGGWVSETGRWRNGGTGGGDRGYEGGIDSEGLLVRALTPRLSQIARLSQRTSGLRKTQRWSPTIRPSRLRPWAHTLHPPDSCSPIYTICIPPMPAGRVSSSPPPHMVAHVSHMYPTRLSTQTPRHKQARSHSDLRLDGCMRPSLSV